MTTFVDKVDAMSAQMDDRRADVEKFAEATGYGLAPDAESTIEQVALGKILEQLILITHEMRAQSNALAGLTCAAFDWRAGGDD